MKLATSFTISLVVVPFLVIVNGNAVQARAARPNQNSVPQIPQTSSSEATADSFSSTTAATSDIANENLLSNATVPSLADGGLPSTIVATKDVFEANSSSPMFAPGDIIKESSPSTIVKEEEISPVTAWVEEVLSSVSLLWTVEVVPNNVTNEVSSSIPSDALIGSSLTTAITNNVTDDGPSSTTVFSSEVAVEDNSSTTTIPIDSTSSIIIFLKGENKEGLPLSTTVTSEDNEGVTLTTADTNNTTDEGSSSTIETKLDEFEVVSSSTPTATSDPTKVLVPSSTSEATSSTTEEDFSSTESDVTTEGPSSISTTISLNEATEVVPSSAPQGIFSSTQVVPSSTEVVPTSTTINDVSTEGPLSTMIASNEIAEVVPPSTSETPSTSTEGGLSTTVPSSRARTTTLLSSEQRPSSKNTNITRPPPFVCPSNGKFISNPCSRKFYVCSRKTPYQFYCPGGTIFNSENGVCDWPTNVVGC